MSLPEHDALPALEFEDVHKAFDGTPVLQGVSFRIGPGRTYVLLGKSGAGKTVLLKHAAGLLHPDQGQVRIEGEDLAVLSPEALQNVREKLGVLFQSGALFDSLTVFDNVAFPLRERGHLAGKGLEEEVGKALRLVRLEEFRNAYPSELSGGMKKRIALARAIVIKPRILLDDDPTAGLDPILSARVADILIDTREALGVTSLLITHDLALAFQVADVLGFLHEGRIVAEGPPTLFRQSSHPAVVAFLRAWTQMHGSAASGPYSPG